MPVPRTDPLPPPWTPLADLQVTDPAAVAVLWHPAKRVHLRPFLGRTAGLAEAAALLGIRKTAMSYWLRRLLALGLIRATAVERRGRQCVTVYRCIADRLRVGLADAPLSSHEGVFDDAAQRWHPLTRRALARALARQAPWLSLTIEVREPGGLATELVPQGAGAPADDFLFYWGRLWLTPAERDALRGELDALWTRYAALSDRGGKSAATLVHLVTVPDAPR